MLALYLICRERLETMSSRIAALRDGDTIVFDIAARRLDVHISEEEMNARLRQWKPPTPRYTSGVMAKYAKLVSSASQGAVTL